MFGPHLRGAVPAPGKGGQRMTHRSAKGRVLLTALLLILGISAQASADPIGITGGIIRYMREDPTEFNLIVPDGRLFGTFEFSPGSGGAPWPSYACTGCVAGSTLNPSVSESWAVGTTPTSLSEGSILRVGDSTYALTSFSFDIKAAPVTVPDVNASTDWSKAFSTSPFTMTGEVTAMAPGASLVHWTLFGRGAANVGFNYDNSLQIGWLYTEFQFAPPTGSPTPEPGTMLLFGGGIAAVLARRKARQF